MTMGIVVVASLAARIPATDPTTKTIDLELHEFGDEAWEPIKISFSVTVLNLDVFPLHIAEISQPSPKCLDSRLAKFWIAAR